MGYQNFFATRLTTDIGAADTVITLETAPSQTSGRLVLEARNPTQREVIKYTGVSGTQITGVTRGQGGTSATTHTRNSLVEMNMTAEDLSDLYDAFNTFAASVDDWRNLPYTVGTVTANGNRSYNVPIMGTDVTGIVSNGMRVKLTRTVAAPVQCTSLNGTTQYYSKTTPNKMTFTDDFVVSAWVKVSSYSQSMIVSRSNSTNGWFLELLSSGQVLLVGSNGGALNYSQVASYQSVPLNKWVHIAAQLDMSSFTATTTTSYIMIDGVDVPSSVTRSGTNPTALVQAGNLEIGSYNGGALPFNGKIAQVAIYNAKVTQATILASMNQKLTGTETSLASGYSFSNSITDLNTTTPNDLTANGSAVATNADSPFGNSGVSTTIDYGIVMAKSFSTNTTLTIQVPEGCTIPTSGGVASMDYSTQAVPYGFPRARGKWQVQTILLSDISVSLPTGGTKYNLGSTQLKVPTGDWVLSQEGTVYASVGTGPMTVQAGLSTTNNSFADTGFYIDLETSGTALSGTVNRSKPVSLSVATPYYSVSTVANGTSPTSIYLFGGRGGFVITAENGHL